VAIQPWRENPYDEDINLRLEEWMSYLITRDPENSAAQTSWNGSQISGRIRLAMIL
jgi:hypothetical protein